MPKFNPILLQKVREEQKEEERQEKLKAEAGITDPDIVVKEKGIKEYSLSILKGILYTAFICLIFLGILTVLNPTSQNILIDTVKNLIP